MVPEMTSTSIKLVVAATMLMLLSTFVFASHNEEGLSSDIGYSDTGFVIPEYDTHFEVATELVAPFLFIFVLLQLGFERVLLHTTANNDNLPAQFQGQNNERGRVKKQATLFALIITGMIVPTQMFQYFSEAVVAVFGSMIYIVFGLMFLLFLYFVFHVVRGVF